MNARITHRIVNVAAAFAACVAGLAFVAAPVHAHDHQHAPAMAGGKPVMLTDTILQDQDGRKLRLATDAIGDKLAVVTFVYTNCVDTCPMVSHTFAQVQEKLGPLMEQRVRLLSLTIDPVRDTPARLKQYAASFEPKPGWLWLTGDRNNVTRALQAFGVTVTNIETHPAQVLVGDPRANRWVRLYDIDRPQDVLAKVNELLAARNQAAAHGQDPAATRGPGMQSRETTWAGVIR